MKGNDKIIEHLNDLLAGELTAIDQYFIHSRMYEDWGYSKLFERIKHEHEEETEHATLLIQRILFLEGLPNVQDLGKVMIGEDVKEALECDLKMEMKAIPDLRAAVVDAEELKDFVSRDLFRSILDAEEEHVDWLETQMGLIEKLGLENYQQSQT